MDMSAEKLERKALTAVLALAGAAILVAVQLRAGTGLTAWSRRLLVVGCGDSLPGGRLVTAAVLGLIFGMIGCPVCGVSLAACVSLRQRDARYVLLSIGLFSLGRLAAFLSIGIVAWSGLRLAGGLCGGAGGMVVFCAVGALMLVLGVQMFAVPKAKPSCPGTQPGAEHRSLVGYLLWGAGVGIACGTEALVFVLPAVAPGTGVAAALLVLVVFCLAAVIPIALLVVAAALSVSALGRVMSPGARRVVRYAGGVFVMFFGTQFICLGLRGLVNA